MSAEQQSIDPWARRFSPEAGHLGDTRGDVMGAMEGAIAVYEGKGQSLENYVHAELMKSPGDYPLWAYQAGYIVNDDYFPRRRREEVAWVASKLLGGGEQANKVWNSALRANLAPDDKQSATRTLIALFFPDAASKSRQLFTGIVALEAMRARVLHLGGNLPSPPTDENRQKMINEALNWADENLFLVNNDQGWEILGNDSLFYLAFAMTKRFIGENQPLPAAELPPPEEPAQADLVEAPVASELAPDVPPDEPVTPAVETAEPEGGVDRLATFLAERFEGLGIPPGITTLAGAFAWLDKEMAPLRIAGETAFSPELRKDIGRFFDLWVKNLETWDYWRDSTVFQSELCRKGHLFNSCIRSIYLPGLGMGSVLTNISDPRREQYLDITSLTFQTGKPFAEAALILDHFVQGISLSPFKPSEGTQDELFNRGEVVLGHDITTMLREVFVIYEQRLEATSSDLIKKIIEKLQQAKAEQLKG